MRHFAASIALVSLVAIAACSGPDKTEPTAETTEKAVAENTEPKAPETREEAPDQGDGIPWDQKSHEQQGAYMKHTVMPKMKTVFQSFDSEEFSEFKCSTCHGENARERHFEMPNPDLPRITDFQKLEAEHPKEMEWMKKSVVPEMAALLGQEPYNPQTHQGFGCGGCHVME